MASFVNNSVLHQFRVIVIGDSSVGKSSLVRGFVNKKFKEKSQPTIGVNFYAATIHLNDVDVKLQIWDTAGQEKYRSIIHSYYRNCAGCFIVYDVTDRSSFYNIDSWLSEAKTFIDNEDTTFILVGHKIDRCKYREVTTSEGEKYASSHDMMFLETSSIINCNVENVFYTMAEEISKKRLPESLKVSHQQLLANNMPIDSGDFMMEKPPKTCCI